LKIVGFTRRQSWENDLNRAKHTQGNRETFFSGRPPHFFGAFLDSS